MVTLKKIAELANVSIGTVDRVVHNRGEVAPETEQKIRSIVKALDYQPNIFARNLVLSKSFQFGVIMPKLNLDSGYWQQTAIGINRAQKELKPLKVKVKYFYYNKYSETSFEKTTQRVMADSLDGILIAPGNSKIFHRLVSRMTGIPFVIFGSIVLPLPCLSCIGQDAFQSGLMAGKLMHLAARQNGSLIAIRIKPVDSHVEERCQGFQAYFKDIATYPVFTYDVNGNGNIRHFTTIFNKILTDHKDVQGIFVTNVLAHKLADQIKSRNLQQKIHLIGYDLVEANINYLREGVIDFLISQRPKIQGYRGIYTLYRHLVLQEPVQEKVMMQLEIVTRENIDYYQLYETEF
jgi:LacI family transcriptional regulator